MAKGAGRDGRVAACWPAPPGSAGPRADRRSGCFQLIGPRQQLTNPVPGQDVEPRCLDTVASASRTLPARRPDPGPGQQCQELEAGPPPFGYRQHLLGELLGGVEVPAAPAPRLGQRAQADPRRKNDGQTPSRWASAGAAGPGGISGFGQAVGLRAMPGPAHRGQVPAGPVRRARESQEPPPPHVRPPSRSLPGTGRHAGGSTGCRRCSARPVAASASWMARRVGCPRRNGLRFRCPVSP